MAQGLSAELVRTLKKLALDGTRRTDARRRLHIDGTNNDDHRNQASQEGIKRRLAESNPMVSMVIERLGSTEKEFMPHAIPGLDPVTEAALDIIESVVSIKLPGDLRDFYSKVGNGGVGPGFGIYNMNDLLERYRWSIFQPVGPQGQEWPRHLLPICGDDWDAVSIDLNSGEIVYWDISQLDTEEDNPQSAPWAQSFKFVAGSLEQWLRKWLEETGVPILSNP